MINRRSFFAALASAAAGLRAALGFQTLSVPATVQKAGPKTCFVDVYLPDDGFDEAEVLARACRQFPGMTILVNEFDGQHSSFWPVFQPHHPDVYGVTRRSPTMVVSRGLLLYRDTPEDMYGYEPAEQVWILDEHGFRQRERHIDINGCNWNGAADTTASDYKSPWGGRACTY